MQSKVQTKTTYQFKLTEDEYAILATLVQIGEEATRTEWADVHDVIQAFTQYLAEEDTAVEDDDDDRPVTPDEVEDVSEEAADESEERAPKTRLGLFRKPHSA